MIPSPDKAPAGFLIGLLDRIAEGLLVAAIKRKIEPEYVARLVRNSLKLSAAAHMALSLKIIQLDRELEQRARKRRSTRKKKKT